MDSGYRRGGGCGDLWRQEGVIGWRLRPDSGVIGRRGRVFLVDRSRGRRASASGSASRCPGRRRVGVLGLGVSARALAVARARGAWRRVAVARRVGPGDRGYV